MVDVVRGVRMSVGGSCAGNRGDAVVSSGDFGVAYE